MLYQLIVYVPESHLELVKQALFDAGAGRIGNYDYCCFQSSGTGQFRPLSGSQAFIGEPGKLEKIKEWKIELVFEPALASKVLDALFAAHPYEEPAYAITPVMTAIDIDKD